MLLLGLLEMLGYRPDCKSAKLNDFGALVVDLVVASVEVIAAGVVPLSWG